MLFLIIFFIYLKYLYFLEDYEGALLTFTEISNIISNIDKETIGVYNDILFR